MNYNKKANIDVLVHSGLTPLSDILAPRRISIFGHIARFESDVPTHMALRRHVDLSVDRSSSWSRLKTTLLVGSAHVGSIKFGGTRTPGTCHTTWSWCWSDATALAGYAIMMTMMMMMMMSVN